MHTNSVGTIFAFADCIYV